MILIPELETVVILVPRTGSGALYRAVLAAYPKAMMIYRHMEADGVPQGYDRWRKVGVVRHPLDRLWSLYKFLRTFNGTSSGSRFGGFSEEAHGTLQRGGVERPFEDWLLNNQIVFTGPYGGADRNQFYPQYTVRHHLPENRKSQFIHLRPDLGTDIYRFETEMPALWTKLKLDAPEKRTINVTAREPMPVLSLTTRDRLHRVFAWDFEVTKQSAYAL